ncbi:cellulase (glycosyl hydrolase family 5) [Kordia sp. SMS9]|uniref:glycoside hydrolase family 2 TIM barrel-domain containing protein n=1 Tax=Kordia sp. SMS9 TaxID=2282170 RepID=UPI000E0D0343|nr:glycoside hydrolase family 2 TIM barrel-domain containing protein [Kordia sp. SMS9]AXG68823.1 cellulase (glycosyl hydrolase family 5) [Kordia sp. SMS9]
MVTADKNIMRSFLVLTYVVIISMLIFLISSAFTYLNTGADRSKMLHTEVKKADVYLPKMNWANDGNEGRKLDNQTLAKIESDYLNAWYVKHVAYKTNQTMGIDDYYTENARKNVINFVSQNQQQNISVHATTLSHQPNIEFFSEDGQLIVLTDENVLEYKQLYKDGMFVMETTETATYKVVLLLEDGFWRVRHLVKESVQTDEKVAETQAISNLHIKGINYYPQATPWDMFGDQFDLEIIKKDFDIMKDAGFNTIRIFIPYEDFGKANVKEEKLQKLQQVLDAAESKQLKAVVTLFDFYGNYEILDWTLTQRHAETIISNFKNHEAILAWDIKNEPNLDFESRGKQNVLAWLESMISLVKSIDNQHLTTIGWSNTENAHLLQDKLDFVSFHYYNAAADFTQEYANLKSKIIDKPIVLGEFGQSSYGGFWKPFAGSEKKQANYYKEMEVVLKAENISYIAWTLYDFKDIPSSVVGNRPWRTNPQKKFGLIDSDGKKKLAFEVLEE